MKQALRYSRHCQWLSQFYLHTLRFIRKRNEPAAFAFPAAAGIQLVRPTGVQERCALIDRACLTD